MNKKTKILKLQSHAKINIGLDIIGKRADGYHELRSVFQEVNWGDVVTLEPVERGIHFKVNIPEIDHPENLCVKAARLLYDKFPGGIKIELHKRIPMGAGLGGGSSNAATVIKGINQLFGLGLTIGEMADLGAGLGSDVPFFIYGKTAHVSGRGEIIHPIHLQCLPRGVVLILPGIHLSTIDMYKKVKNYLTNPEKSLIITPSFAERLSCSQLSSLANGFEEIALNLHPHLKRIKELLLSSGCEVAMMSGSGSAFYGLYEKDIRIPPELQNYEIVKTTVVV